MPSPLPTHPDKFPVAEYTAWVESLKARVRQTQVRASLAVNKELVQLYWIIGSELLERQERQGWGTKVLERLARDMKVAFPDMTGLSRTNLAYMRSFASGLARGINCPTACWTIAMGPQHRAAGQAA